MARVESSLRRMPCMEIWGGNQPVDSAVALTGLDAWVYSRPQPERDGTAAAGGGDLYYVSSCASGRITRLLVADVSGHGSSVSRIALDLRALMRRYINYVNPARFMQAMNDQFVGRADNGVFATAIVATYYCPTRVLTLCNAGHPVPLLYRAAERRWLPLERPPEQGRRADLPLGIAAGTSYEPFSVRLERGDFVLCYSDSLIEVRDGAGSVGGMPRLLERVQRVDVAQPERFIPALLAELTGDAPGGLDHDDVTVLLFAPNRRRVTLRDNLLAPWRVVRAWWHDGTPGGLTGCRDGAPVADPAR